MDDDTKDVIKAGLEVILAPVTDLAANAIGLAGGDWLHEQRKRNRARLREKTEKILRDRKVEPMKHPAPATILPLIDAAQDESRDDLLDLWARLLAAALDPARCEGYRRQFADIVKQFEPLDAVILPLLRDSITMDGGRIKVIGQRLTRREDEVELSFANLIRLGCLDPGHTPAAMNRETFPITSSLGRELLRIVGL